jgi:3-phosphoshikimate 1-carboxyvinyltransferase
VSGLLFALPLLDGDSEIVLTSPLESASYVDLTLSCLRDFGIDVGNESYARFTVRGGQRYQPREYRVEGDYSQAAFFLVAAALGADIEVRGLRSDSLQGDKKILELLENAGAALTATPEGGVRVTRPPQTPLRAQQAEASDIPDLVPPLAVLMALSEGVSEITNAARLRWKESDRLAAVTRELNALGAKVEERGDALRITGVPELAGGDVRAWGDHRVAMMAAVAAIRCKGPVTIDDPDCVAKSYPGFWKDFERTAQ